ncbi:flagellar hook protein FlgE [Neorhizobium alkalisoli]|uniref:Flagellar hook protein FlgE n=1 Tax=Neorhizobium alkalisoli TaxID=528178 RepID=A0A561QSW3_9HYPH|nr:flagellar hook protein FlgE [Neorhizobium alkalisoli]TWF53376.1 flagellar hook protein FlgE [Neorhizobium alkalisoli]
MSIFGSMKTAVSGMNAQSNRLSTVGDNIANSSTVGYKRASTSFSSMVLPSTAGSYSSGGVQTNVRYSISEQGGLSYTTSSTDLAIQGGGFFIVSDSSGTPYLSRAGSFVPNDSGELVNSAGYTLMGYSYDTGTPAAVVNGFDGLEPVNVKKASLVSSPTTTGTFPVNLNADADPIDPTDAAGVSNSATTQYTDKSSLVAYDSLGRKVLYDFYYTKTADNEWQVAVYRQDQATAGTGFPYATVPTDNTFTLNFDDTTGALTTDPAVISFTDTLSPPTGTGQTISIDFAGTTQKAFAFTPGNATVDGSAPSAIDSVSIDNSGVVYAVYADGQKEPLYRIPLATVQSPDNLTPLNGNVYAQGNDSGIITTGFPGSGNFGSIYSGALENSNVDIASELTEMIEAQRIYTANSKVFQTGSDLMDVLINLKR